VAGVLVALEGEQLSRYIPQMQVETPTVGRGLRVKLKEPRVEVEVEVEVEAEAGAGAEALVPRIRSSPHRLSLVPS